MAKAIGQPYRTRAAGVTWKPSKWDGFTLVRTEHPYRHQKGSGRSDCFELAEDGMSVGEWTKRCAGIGYDSKFVTGSLLKLQGAKQCAWRVSETDDQGRTLAQIKSEREVDADKAAAKAAAAAEAKAAREKLAEERKAKREQEKAAKAEEKALREAAKRQEAEKQADEPVEGKAPKRSKKKQPPAEDGAEAA